MPRPVIGFVVVCITARPAERRGSRLPYVKGLSPLMANHPRSILPRAAAVLLPASLAPGVRASLQASAAPATMPALAWWAVLPLALAALLGHLAIAGRY